MIHETRSREEELFALSKRRLLKLLSNRGQLTKNSPKHLIVEAILDQEREEE